jgi:hypothetical protein
MRHLILATCGSIVLSSVASAATLTQGFENGIPSDWAIINNSQPVGTTSWFEPLAQEQPFGAHIGPAANDYAAANFNSVNAPTSTPGTISTWLLTPMITYAAGDIVRFHTRTVAPVLFPDRLEVRYSTAAASTNVGATASSVGDFGGLLVSVNPTLTSVGYPTAWTAYTVQMPVVGTGRIAFRYHVTDAGASAPNGDYIGLDTVSVLRLIRGDVNGDDVVNNQDIAPFVQLLTDANAFAAAYPFVAGSILGDVNNDGFVNNQDISPFVALLTGGRGIAEVGGDPEFAPLVSLVPEPASLSLLALGGLAALRRRR